MRSVGQVAYEAYADFLGWRAATTGVVLPPWKDLSQDLKDAWTTAGLAAAIAKPYGAKDALA